MRYREWRLGRETRGVLIASGLLAIGALAPCLGTGEAAAQVPVARASDSPTAAPAATATYVSPAEARLRGDVAFLAADEQEGRAPGTKGIEASADHIAAVFKELGLKTAPGADGYFQTFTLTGQPRLGEPLDLAVKSSDGQTLKAVSRTDFSALAIGVNGVADAVPIVFAGYGITAKQDDLKLDYDDYAGFDVKDKAVLILRREPQQNDERSSFDGKKTTEFSALRHKATNAFQHGAKIVLLVNDFASLGTDNDTLLSLGSAGSEVNSKLPFVQLTREFADKILKAAGEPSLTELEHQIDKDLKPRTRELKNVTLSAHVTIERPSVDTKNVIGVLEGSGPHANETIVVGGHYDHLGRGGLMSGSLAFLSRDIHNGADDNASGTAMVLEVARRLAARRDPLPRRVVFIAFSGEERGLLGSQYYVEHPLYKLASTVMMINFDMVGRLNDKNELTMIGTGTSPNSQGLVETLGKNAGLTIKTVSGMTDGFGGSDHQSFYGKSIPVLFAFTGIHSDYHRPSDDSDRINYAGMAKIADYMELILLDVARRPERPEFARLTAPKRTAQSASTSMSVTMGVMPDYADESKAGMKLSDVREGGPAAKAGIKGGDTITSIGGKPISTIYDYMESLGRYKPGDHVDVVVKRDGKDVTIKVDLGKPNVAPNH
ncbi:M20/M25/M40 family metallo-hydrolase [Paludisphaera borealis]|uniref:Aminopeptidase YwaD n=1 Tax=Paludisphaera borealis TaxID=1387353 RepID=A0A1U7CM91_9BACT|nr:M20/M25/M40 family metallo-hydrolase [Paludisphaera borealis]APW60029.1 Aminopeptidase YwaD [Paludisphaera borealis]